MGIKLKSQFWESSSKYREPDKITGITAKRREWGFSRRKTNWIAFSIWDQDSDFPCMPPCQEHHHLEPQRPCASPSVPPAHSIMNGTPLSWGNPLCLQVRRISEDIKCCGDSRRMVMEDAGNVLTFLEFRAQILVGERFPSSLYGTHCVLPPC